MPLEAIDFDSCHVKLVNAQYRKKRKGVYGAVLQHFCAPGVKSAGGLDLEIARTPAIDYIPSTTAAVNPNKGNIATVMSTSSRPAFFATNNRAQIRAT